MIKKPLSQLVLQDLHLKLNHKLKDLKTVPIQDFQGFLTSIKNDLNNEILGDKIIINTCAGSNIISNRK